MVYRRTAKIAAQAEGKRLAMIGAALDVISRVGLDQLTTDLVTERAGVANGLLYKYFPDKTELLAAVVQQLLERDLKAVREATIGDPVNSLAAALSSFYYRLSEPFITRMTSAAPVYQTGMRQEFARLIRAARPDLSQREAMTAAAAALGAIYGVAAMSEGSKVTASAVVYFSLRGIGIPARVVESAVS